MDGQVFGRRELAELAVRSYAWDDVIPPGAPASCGNGKKCVLYEVSGSRVGIEWATPHGAGALCIACVMRETQRQVAEAVRTVRAPFAVRVGAGEFGPRECFALGVDGRVAIDANFPLSGAMAVAYEDGQFTVRGTPATVTGNEAVDLGYSDPCVASQCAFMHRPWVSHARMAIAPLIFFCETRGTWRRVRVSAAAGVGYMTDPVNGWERRVWRAWKRNPGRRLWIGAVLDAAAAEIVRPDWRGSDEFGPWVGDLPDVLRTAQTMSLTIMHDAPALGAPAGQDVEFLEYKTGDGPAQRRQLPGMLARRVREDDGAILWATVREALLHILLGTFPVPDKYVALGHRVAALKWWYTLPTETEDAALWIQRYPDIATIATFYVRYVNMAMHPGVWARGGTDRPFWHALGSALERVRTAVVQGDMDTASLAVQTWISLTRNPHRVPRRPAAAVVGVQRVRIHAPRSTHTFRCTGCRRIVFALRGSRIACKQMRRAHSSATGGRACCCAAGRNCTQRRKRGCCCSTRSDVMGVVRDDSADVNEFLCARRACGRPVERVDTTAAIVTVSGSRPLSMVACADCGLLCYYRRDHHWEGYHCGCTARPDPNAPCSLCGTQAPLSTMSRVLIGCDLHVARLCHTCFKRRHSLQRNTTVPGTNLLEEERFLMSLRLLTDAQRNRALIAHTSLVHTSSAP